MKKPQKMYKNLKMLQNLDKTQIEGLTEKCKNCKNVQKIENLDKTQIEGLKKMQKLQKCPNIWKNGKFFKIEKMQKV